MAKLTLLNGRVPTRQRPEDGGNTLAEVKVGSVAIDDDGNVYRLVKNDSAGTINNNEVTTYRNADTSDYVVTADISNGSQHRPAGICVSTTAIAVDEFFWVQISGRVAVDTETVTPVVGDPVIAHATADGEADNGINTTAEAEHVPRYFGVFLAVEVAGSPDLAFVQLKGMW